MLPGSGFAPLPFETTHTGHSRETGVEVEFSGLSTEEAVDVVVRALGGTAEGDDPFVRHVKGTSIGEIKVELDTVARAGADVAIVKHGLNAARAVVPIEIVSNPLDRRGLETFSTFLSRLRRAGAQGSRSGILLGFGVHLNPGVVGLDHPHTLQTMRAYGLLEAHLRHIEKLDMTRRALPYVAPWPDAFITALLDDRVSALDDVLQLAVTHLSSRNHSLDLFPLLKEFARQRFEEAFSDTLTSARPTFHFRLPDCRIDEADWDLTQPWVLWHLVETVAADPALMARLTAAWHDQDSGLFKSAAWARQVSDILQHEPSGEFV